MSGSSASMSTSPTCIVVAVGVSDHAYEVMAVAIRIASLVPRPLLHVVHVLPESAHVDAVGDETHALLAREFGQGRVSHSCDVARRALPQTTVEGHLEYGDPATAILELARRTEAEFLVIGPCDRTPWLPARLGTVTNRLLRGAPCDVVVSHLRSGA